MHSRHATQFAGLYEVIKKPISDERGSFERIFCETFLKDFAPGFKARQVNRTVSKMAGTIRGLHFQWPPHAEHKVITCVKGRVFDVVVDIRAGSKTFLDFHATELSDDNSKSLIVPPGFAHGFQTLCDECELIYTHSADFEAHSEGVIDAFELLLGIEWPVRCSVRSEKDEKNGILLTSFKGVKID